MPRRTAPRRGAPPPLDSIVSITTIPAGTEAAPAAPPPPDSSVRRRLLIWLAAALVLAIAATGAVVVANATVFGAAGFVRVYLDALARGDADGALSIPGVDPGDADPALLTREALGELTVLDVRERGGADGIHEVEARWAAAEGEGSTVYRVERIGTTAGLFPRWGFAETPLATLELTLAHDDRVRVNGLDATTDEASAATHSFAVFTPGRYELRHESRWLTSGLVLVEADRAGGAVEATVEVVANAALLAEVDEASRALLDECAEQTVLFPSGCPFGQFISNRVASDPRWSIVEYPELEVTATEGEPRWRVEPTPGVANIVVEVQSIFDGSLDMLDQDVDFEVAFELHLGVGDRLRVVPVDTLDD